MLNGLDFGWGSRRDGKTNIQYLVVIIPTFYSENHQSYKSCRKVLFYFHLIIGFNSESNCCNFTNMPQVSDFRTQMKAFISTEHKPSLLSNTANEIKGWGVPSFQTVLQVPTH